MKYVISYIHHIKANGITTENFIIQCQHILHKIPQNLHKNISCIYCNKLYSRNDSLKRHLKSCDEKENEIFKQQIEKLTNDLEKLKRKSTKKIITYNTLNNNSNNLTNINNIGKEQISELSHDERRYIMSYGMDSVISLTEHLNFNEKLPHNHQPNYKNQRFL